MKKYSKIIAIITFLTMFIAALIISCGNPHKNKKIKMKHKMEMRMKNDTIHTDSAKQVRMKMWREKRKHLRDSIH